MASPLHFQQNILNYIYAEFSDHDENTNPKEVPADPELHKEVEPDGWSPNLKGIKTWQINLRPPWSNISDKKGERPNHLGIS